MCDDSSVGDTSALFWHGAFVWIVFLLARVKIFRKVLNKFIKAKNVLLHNNVPASFLASYAMRYLQQVYANWVVPENVVEFMFSTVIEISRSKGWDSNQKAVYNGHKCKHALKFQAITTPDGLCVHMNEPEVGRRHDMYLCAESKVERSLVGNEQYVVYSNSGYSRQNFLKIPFERGDLTPAESAFNTEMSTVRISVEWYFGAVKLYSAMATASVACEWRRCQLGISTWQSCYSPTFETA